MDPAPLNQIIREKAGAVAEGIFLPVLLVSPKYLAGDIHLPELRGRLLKGRLKPLDLFLLTQLGFLELGDVCGCDQHDRGAAVIIDLSGPDMPPEPAFSIPR